MAEHNDGGPAFPSDPYIDHPAHGRIHKAVPALCQITPEDNIIEIAERAYQIADAMISERSK